MVASSNDFYSKVNEQISTALALKMNLSTFQHANERALGTLQKNGAARCSLRQTLQARASVYDSHVNPPYFEKAVDISGKAKSPVQRRRIRSQLIGAPLFVAQVGLNNIQQALSEGDPVELETIKLADEGTMAELLQKLARAPFASVLKLLSKKRSSQVLDGLHQETEDHLK